MAISEPLARVLAGGRSRFNARVAETRHRHPGFDTAAFAAFLGYALDPVIVAVHTLDPERVAVVTHTAYELALSLVAQGVTGSSARQPWLDRVWRELAPRYVALIAAQPQAVLAALSNAAIQLSQWPQVRVEEWLQQMNALADQVTDLVQLRALGQLLAWRAGMAHYRSGALAAANLLPPSLALAALDAPLDGDWPALRDALLADPWHTPQGHAHGLADDGIHIGAFTGFGGYFAQPPQVRAEAEGFVVRSAGRHFLLFVDIHGAVLMPADAATFEAASATKAAVPEAHLVALAWPKEQLISVADKHTLAVASPYTHTIALFPRA